MTKYKNDTILMKLDMNDVVILNEIAERIMEEYDVPYNDLYSFVKIFFFNYCIFFN